MKRKGYWVMLCVMIVVGALLIAHYYFQRLPMVPDVNAQMSQFDNVGSYLFTGSYSLGSIGSYAGLSSYGMPGSTGLICGGQTSDTCYIDCGWTSRTCNAGCNIFVTSGNVFPGNPVVVSEPFKTTPPTSNTCSFTCPNYLISVFGGSSSTNLLFSGGSTILICPTSTLFGGKTSTSIICPGGSTGLFGLGGSTSIFCPGAGTYTALGCSRSDETSKNCYEFGYYTNEACNSFTGATCGNTCGNWSMCNICIGYPISDGFSATQSPAW